MKRLFPWLLPAAIFVIGLTAALALRGGAEEIKPPAQTPSQIASEQETIRLMFAGDVMLSRLVGKKIAASGDWRYPFLRIATTTAAADMFFVNLETSVSDRGHQIGSMYSFRSDPRTLEGLKYAGVDVVSIANNHIWDFADDAFLDTQKYLREAGIKYAGGGESFEAAHSPAVLAARGARVAVLAYTNLLPKSLLSESAGPTSAGYADWNQVVKDIAKARSEADIVAVSFHWGDEYLTKHNADQEKYAYAAIDAGADLVIGHHPHVQQEVERYKNGIIAYSLGNFVFDQYFEPAVMQSKILEIDVRGGKITGAKEIPVQISTGSEPYVSGPAKDI